MKYYRVVGKCFGGERAEFDHRAGKWLAGDGLDHHDCTGTDIESREEAEGILQSVSPEYPNYDPDITNVRIEEYETEEEG